MTGGRALVRRLWERLPETTRGRVAVSGVGRFLQRSLWARPGQFSSPYPDLERLAARPVSDVHELPGIDLRTDAQLVLLEKIVGRQVSVPEEETAGFRYHLDNPRFAYADGLIAAGMLCHLAPRRYVEIGSGWSTLLTLDIMQRHRPECAVTVVDPFPDARVVDEPACTVLAMPVQDAPREIFAELEAGDVLFIDSSHVVKAGSDVNTLVFEVLPALAPGVVVHLHDVHWPFEYPDEWARRGRAWTESYLVRSFLMYNDAFEIMLWGSYLIAEHRAWFAERLPLALRNPGGSIWLRRRET